MAKTTRLLLLDWFAYALNSLSHTYHVVHIIVINEKNTSAISASIVAVPQDSVIMNVFNNPVLF